MPVVPPLQTDSYPGYDAMCDYAHRVAEAAPHLVRLYTIGDSAEGRALLLAEVTNQGTGPASEKPALWVDGNSRGGELAGSMACLALLQRLAAGHGRDELVTALLDSRTFYILPRMAPDGAEHCLATGEVVQSGRRSAIFEPLRGGLLPADVDGDGRILQMRVEDPRGEWKASRRDPRLLLRRSPDDRHGPFYRLYREGFLDGPLGGPVRMGAGTLDRDLTRNFPGSDGHGGCPLSEPETRAVADFLRSRPNLCAALSFRSSEGRICLPAPKPMPPRDAALMRLFGQRASEITGYPLVADALPGDFVDWVYSELGLVALRSSLWSLPRMAGLELGTAEPTETELLAILRWLDRERGGEGFQAWSLYQHPQLGPVEIGGWDLLTTWLNPPPGDDLEEECRRNAELALSMASALPRLVSVGCREEQVGWADAEEGADEELSLPVALRKVVLEVANDGFLPTWITEIGRTRRVPVQVELLLPEGVELLLGVARAEMAPLAGTGTVHVLDDGGAAWFGGCAEEQRRGLEWLVRGDGEITLRAFHPRAGALETRTAGEEAPPTAAPPPPVYAPRPATPPRPATAPVRGATPTGRPAGAAPTSAPVAPARPPAGTPPVRPAVPGAPSARPQAPGPRPSAPVSRPPAEMPSREAPAVPASHAPAGSGRETPGFRPAARLSRAGEGTAPVEEGPSRTAFRVTPPPAGRGLGASAPPPGEGAPSVGEASPPPRREDSPLRKEVPGRVLGDTMTGRVLGTSPGRPGAPATGRPAAPARTQEEDMTPLVPVASVETRIPARPRPVPGTPGAPVVRGPVESAPSAPPPAEEDLEAPPPGSRIPAPLLLRRPRQPERKE